MRVEVSRLSGIYAALGGVAVLLARHELRE